MSSEGSDVQRQKTTEGRVAEKLLTIEHEPAAGGGQRSIVHPPGLESPELETKWLAVSSDHLVSLDDVR